MKCQVLVSSFFADLVLLWLCSSYYYKCWCFFALICTMFFHHQKKWCCMFAPLLFSRKLHVFLFPLLRFMLLCLQIMNRICVLLHTHTHTTHDETITFTTTQHFPNIKGNQKWKLKYSQTFILTSQLCKIVSISF